MAEIFECVNLSKSYGSRQALAALNFSIPRGRIVGLLGPNGSGKTTLLKLANGLLTPTQGQVLIDGHAPGIRSKRLVSYLPERSALPQDMNARQLLRYYGEFFPDFDEQRARQMLQNLGIEEKLGIKQMSKGTREKVQLILTMSRDASLYLLDEPIGGVDPATREYILRTIIGNYNPDAAVIISTHLIADVEQILDEVLFLRQGQLVLQADAEQIRETKGMSVDALFREEFKCLGN